MTRKTTLTLILGASLLVGWTTFAVADSKVRMWAKRCVKCHGDNGNSDKDKVPSIAGISSKYFMTTMKDYKKKKRVGETFRYKTTRGRNASTDMNAVAKRLNSRKLKALGDYFAAQTFIPRVQDFDFYLAREGENVHQKRCEKCHEDNGRSPDNDSGILAGQWKPYLESELELFVSGERKTPKKMKKQLDKLKSGDIPALLHFFASQQ